MRATCSHAQGSMGILPDEGPVVTANFSHITAVQQETPVLPGTQYEAKLPIYPDKQPCSGELRGHLCDQSGTGPNAG